MESVHPSRIKITNVYRVSGEVLVALTKANRSKPEHDEYTITSNHLLVFGKCRNGMKFEVTYTRDAVPMHRKFTIEGGCPFVRLRDL